MPTEPPGALLNCESCRQPVPDGATECPTCHRPIARSQQASDRSASTVVFRPEELGLPGDVPSYGSGPATVEPPTRRRGWVWGLVGLVAVAVVALGAVLVLRGEEDPQVAVGSVTPTPEVSATTSAPPATPTAPPATEPLPTEQLAPSTGQPTPAASAPAASPPTDLAEGFLVFGSDDREALPSPVLVQPERAWDVELPGAVLDIRGDQDLVVVTIEPPDGAAADRVVAAYDAITGAPRWTVPLDGPIAFSEVVLAQTVVLTIERAAEGDAELRGIDRDTGETRWSTEVASRGGLTVLPLVDGTLTVTDVGQLAHLDPEDGTVQPLLEGEQVQLGRDRAASYAGQTVRVVDLAEGTPVYEVWIGALGDTGEFVFTDDRVVVYDGETIWSVDRDGGREWDHRLSDPAGALRQMVLVPSGEILVSTSGEDGTVALAPDNGQVRWRSPIAVTRVGQFDGRLRGVADGDDTITAIDLADGTDVAAFSDTAPGGGAYANGVYYAGDDSLSAVSLADGETLWSLPMPQLSGRQAIPGAVVTQLGEQRIALFR